MVSKKKNNTFVAEFGVDYKFCFCNLYAFSKSVSRGRPMERCSSG